MITKYSKYIDNLTSLMTIITPILTLPQLINIWFYREVQGVSLITWLMYLSAAIIWLLYGILHKEKRITVLNSLLVIINGFIVIGILIFGENYF